jgi:RNA polymerase sigma-70 factor, ECF subfamily
MNRHIGGEPLAELVRHYHRPMLAFARSMLPTSIAAEEAVQDAWVQVVKSADTFEGRSSVGTWLMAIVRHTALRHREREARLRTFELLGSEDDDPLAGRMHQPGHPDAGHWSIPPQRRFLPEEHTINQELVAHLRTALNTLPPRQRQIVILRDLVGLPAEEAADVLGVSDQVQRALLYRARGNLRNELEKRYPQ